jgi:protein-L-isoaspartate(D-aspartate) O-methyltransferase
LSDRCNYRSLFWLITALFCHYLVSPAESAQRADPFASVRESMVQREVVGRGVRNPRVIQAMRTVPRHEFVPINQRKFAYADAAIPIGNHQTITSPFVVAYMTAKLDPQKTDKVLEIGTGSGYQASVLSQLVDQVYTIEIVAPLGQRAERTINELGYENVHCRIGDGYQGWPEQAPFDKIIVTCSPENVPPALVAQLRDGGLLVVPLGTRFQQSLYLFRKVSGQLQREELEATFFVPMTGEAERQRDHAGDDGIPNVVNGDFQELGEDSDTVPGWFYARQCQIVAESAASPNDYVLQLTNRTAGQAAHVHQPISLDGQQVRSVALSARVSTTGIHGTNDWTLPRVELTFYDKNRASIKSVKLGPWQGHRGWSSLRKTSPVPGRTHFAVVSIGMFGAVGQFAVDDVQVEVVDPDNE